MLGKRRISYEPTAALLQLQGGMRLAAQMLCWSRSAGMFTDPVRCCAFADIKHLKKKKKKVWSRIGTMNALCLLSGVDEVNKLRWICADMSGWQTCAHAPVRAYVLAPFRRLRGGEQRNQRATGPMPDEIMNLSNGILGNGG